jgi:pimeloyl-ACP methyl ester carboxylesterase
VSAEIRVFRSPEDRARYESAYDGMLKRWPVPFTELYIPSRYGDTHVVASGSQDDPPLILLHSAGSGAVQWFRNVGPFSEAHRTYAIDVIGEVNKSHTALILSRREQFLEWMLDLLDRLDVQRADVVGNSFGGFLTFNLALYAPQRVRKAVLISPAATFKQIWPWYWHLAFPYKIGYILGSERIILSGFNWIWQGFPRDEAFRNYTELSKTSGFPCNKLRPPVYTDEELRRIHTPMLLLIGDHEVIYDPGQVMNRATNLVPGLRAELIPNANHNAQVTAPDLVNRKVLEFLSD